MSEQTSKELQLHSGSGDNCRDKYIYQTNLHPPSPESFLESLKEMETEAKNNDEMVEFVDALADYLQDYPERNVIGLEEKLKNAKMDSLVDEAVVLKERFAKKLYRGQLSHNTQLLYAHSLALINTFFTHKVKPLIETGVSRVIFEKALLDEVLMPVLMSTSKADMSITIDHIRGMLYFLTGKCHIKWS